LKSNKALEKLLLKLKPFKKGDKVRYKKLNAKTWECGEIIYISKEYRYIIVEKETGTVLTSLFPSQGDKIEHVVNRSR